MTVRKDAVGVPCGCGCGATTQPGSRFLSGHNAKLNVRRTPDGKNLWCPKCGETKPVDEFPKKGKHRNGDERYGYCRPCHSAYQRVMKLQNTYNLTPDEYDAMLEAQRGVCAICKRPPAKNRLAVDHDHSSGLIRGLICWSCNRGLGYWADSEQRLLAAADYLYLPPAIAVLGERFGRKGRTTNKAPRRKKAKRAARTVPR